MRAELWLERSATCGNTSPMGGIRATHEILEQFCCHQTHTGCAVRQQTFPPPAERSFALCFCGWKTFRGCSFTLAMVMTPGWTREYSTWLKQSLSLRADDDTLALLEYWSHPLTLWALGQFLGLDLVTKGHLHMHIFFVSTV